MGEQTRMPMPDWECMKCGCAEVIKEPQQFADGSTHIRVECAKCKTFIKWDQQGAKSFRDRMFDLVKKLADSTTVSQVNECQRMSRDLMREVEEAKNKVLPEKQRSNVYESQI